MRAVALSTDRNDLAVDPQNVRKLTVRIVVSFPSQEPGLTQDVSVATMDEVGCDFIHDFCCPTLRAPEGDVVREEEW